MMGRAKWIRFFWKRGFFILALILFANSPVFHSLLFSQTTGDGDPARILDRSLSMEDGFWTGTLSITNRWGGVESSEIQMYQKKGDRLIRLLKKGKGTTHYVLIKKGGREIYMRDVQVERRYDRDSSLLDLEMPGSTIPISFFIGPSIQSWMKPEGERGEGEYKVLRYAPLIDTRMDYLDVFFTPVESGGWKTIRLDYYRDDRILYRTIEFPVGVPVISRKTALPINLEIFSVVECIHLDTGRSSRLEWTSFDERIIPPDSFFEPENMGRK